MVDCLLPIFAKTTLAALEALMLCTELKNCLLFTDSAHSCHAKCVVPPLLQ